VSPSKKALDEAEKELLAASTLLEAIRPAVDKVIGSTKPEDQCIVKAWEKARERFRAACAAWAP
jgi:hypothetical protein